MNNNNEQVWVASGMLDAEMIKSLLESFGIKAYLIQESAGNVFGMNFGPLGEVKIYVTSEFSVQAKEILKDYQDGKLEVSDS